MDDPVGHGLRTYVRWLNRTYHPEYFQFASMYYQRVKDGYYDSARPRSESRKKYNQAGISQSKAKR